MYKKEKSKLKNSGIRKVTPNALCDTIRELPSVTLTQPTILDSAKHSVSRAMRGLIVTSWLSNK
jgi:hypothetical protein